jgi:hypothetical protein
MNARCGSLITSEVASASQSARRRVSWRSWSSPALVVVLAHAPPSRREPPCWRALPLRHLPGAAPSSIRVRGGVATHRLRLLAAGRRNYGMSRTDVWWFARGRVRPASVASRSQADADPARGRTHAGARGARRDSDAGRAHHQSGDVAPADGEWGGRWRMDESRSQRERRHGNDPHAWPQPVPRFHRLVRRDRQPRRLRRRSV